MAGSAAAQTVFIKDAKIITNTDQGILETADVLITDGRISDISAGLPAPAGAEIVEGNGLWVTPGLFAPMAQIGLVEIGLESATNDSRASKAKTSVSTLGSDSFNSNSPSVNKEGLMYIFGAMPFLESLTLAGSTGLNILSPATNLLLDTFLPILKPSMLTI